jgi:signal transduction histidine kinase
MIRERSGAIVMNWSSGVVARVDPPRQPVFLLKAGSPLGVAEALFEGPSGLLIAGTHGLALARNGTVRYLLGDRVPEIARLNGIVQTTKGETWVHGQGGLLRFATADLERSFADRRHVPKVKIFGFDEGVPDRFQAGSWRSLVQGGDGRIWLDTLAGTAWINPDVARGRGRTPRPAVTSLRARDGVRLDPDDVVLAKGIGDVEIGFSALGLAAPNRARFRYRLVGNDKGWVDAGSRRQAFYTNLQPGEYRFEVMVANEDGVWSKAPAVVDIKVRPTFLQSRMFLVLCGIAALLFVMLLYRWRLTRATQELARRHGERTAERERIARELHDTLLQAIQGLILTFQGVAGRVPESQGERAKLNEALNRADEVMVEGRERVRGLREGTGPENVDEALRGLMCLAGFSEGTVLKFGVVGAPRPVRPSVSEELIAIASEALFNAARHAGATAVEMVLEYRCDGLKLEILDDGIGFALEEPTTRAPSGHYGVLGMVERAERIGAVLGITKREGGGTMVRVVLREVNRLSRALSFAPFRLTAGCFRA